MLRIEICTTSPANNPDVPPAAKPPAKATSFRACAASIVNCKVNCFNLFASSSYAKFASEPSVATFCKSRIDTAMLPADKVKISACSFSNNRISARI